MNHNCLVPNCTNIVASIDSYYCNYHMPKPCLDPKVITSITEALSEGRKDDQDKLRVDLLSIAGLLKLADVYSIGAKKYGDHNWRAGIKWSRILGAMMRHLLLYMAGEDVDPEDGQHHLASVAWGAFTLIEYEYTHKELDDRQTPLSFDQIHAILKHDRN